MEWFWPVVIVAAILGVLHVVGSRAAVAEAKKAYESALGVLSADPDNNQKRIAALEAGRKFAQAARQAAGQKGIAIFDEVALQNDLGARLGKGAHPGPDLSDSDPYVPPGSRIEQLSRLSELRDKGVLTEHEFETEKQRILSGD